MGNSSAVGKFDPRSSKRKCHDPIHLAIEGQAFKIFQYKLEVVALVVFIFNETARLAKNGVRMPSSRWPVFNTFCFLR